MISNNPPKKIKVMDKMLMARITKIMAAKTDNQIRCAVETFLFVFQTENTIIKGDTPCQRPNNNNLNFSSIAKF